MYKMTALALATGITLFIPVDAASQQDPVLVGQGAMVYSNTCGRCHNARPGSERTDREWIAIVAHMRARANLSKSSAGAVLAFLQATNVPEGMPASPMPQQPTAPAAEGSAAPDDTTRAVPSKERNER